MKEVHGKRGLDGYDQGVMKVRFGRPNWDVVFPQVRRTLLTFVSTPLSLPSFRPTFASFFFFFFQSSRPPPLPPHSSCVCLTSAGEEGPRG